MRPLSPETGWNANQTLSIALLILANLVPLVGVVFWGWSVFAVVMLFWMENVIYGAFNVLRLLFSQGDGLRGSSAIFGKLFMAAFFSVHYGIFTAVHGTFVLVLFGGSANEGRNLDTGSMWDRILDYDLQWAILPLIASHAFSFFVNYLGKGEYRRTTLAKAMSAPYARVAVLHITILGGGFLITWLGEPEVGVVLLVVLKTFMDVKGHIVEHSAPDAAVLQESTSDEHGRDHRKIEGSAS